MTRLPPALSMLAAAALVAGCATDVRPSAAMAAAATPASAEAPAARAPVTILVSIDGFRADYLDRGLTPVLSGLARQGVRGTMRPSFPSKTFPNHWTLVTGVVPDRHGIVANHFTDPARPHDTFTMESEDPFWWNAAEPIWVMAEKAGIRTATMFWPGSNIAWGGRMEAGDPVTFVGGTRPHDWQQYNEAVSDRQRVDAILDWLRRPAATRPGLLTLYFDEVDTAGHADGPDSPAVDTALTKVDTAVGWLVEGLRELGQPANLVVVADHGMAATSDSRVIALDTLTDPADIKLVNDGPFASLDATPGHVQAVERALLRPQPHMQCWRKADMPARLHYGHNDRIPAYVCVADPGWLIKAKRPDKPFGGGNHGYDPADPSMAALFIANGPAFARGRRVGTFDNVDVAPLLRDLLHLPADQRLDGTDAPFRSAWAR